MPAVTKSVNYIKRKISITSQPEMVKWVEESPLINRDKDFMMDILAGLSYKELQSKYNKSESRITQWKRLTFEKLQKYDYECMRKL